MTDTISAIATAPGNAALGIIRISGPWAQQVIDAVVPDARAPKHVRSMRFGHAIDIESKEIIDEVLCFFASAPQTATGEDTAEIHAHGGTLVLNRLLQQTFKAGARAAAPGEFTRRAYTNGKMDLTQAEAVMSLIGAKSERAAQTAAKQLGGAIGKALSTEYEHITNIAAALETCLDFPDEDLPTEQTAQFILQLEQFTTKLSSAVQSYKMGQLLTKGAQVVIAGPSNAGKSTLLNALINEEKALVDSAPGTTRDIVEAQYEIDGVPVTFLDTAGLRFGAQKVEQMGMEKSKKAIQDADLILLVVDGASPLEMKEDVKEMLCTHAARTIGVINKSDKSNFTDTVLKAAGLTPANTVHISAQKQTNLESLHNRMAEFLQTEMPLPEVILTTARQLSWVETALEHAQTAQQILQSNGEPELAAADIRWAREALASLWGKHAQTDVIDTIFSSFCLGK